MERIRTLIVDDEPLAREGIRLLLGRDARFEVVGECGDGAAAVSALRKLSPDLVFLDVQMPEMNGFEVLGKLAGDELPAVIFVTAFDEYALNAFEVHALDYLLKPFDDERFDRALGRARLQVRQQKAHRLSERLLSAVEDFRESAARGGEGRPSYLGRLAVKSAGRVHFLRTEEIDWIEAADYYVKLHVGDRSHLLRQTMSHLESQLDPRRFVRIHRSAIVNLDRVKELRTQPHGDCSVFLADGTQLRLSRGGREKLGALLEGV